MVGKIKIISNGAGKIILFLSLLSFQITFSQIEITGIVLGKENRALEGATILLKTSDSQKTIAYTNSSNTGNFKILIPSGTYSISISYLGYEKFSKIVEVTDAFVDLGIINLIQNTSELKEVFLKAEKSIIQKGDTTIYKTKKFLNGTERNLLDVLLNLPGIGVNKNGKVTYRGKVVDRLLVDDENLYKNQHQFATENISSEMVGNIEVIKNYKDFEYIGTNDKTGITALNITINDDFKNKFTGALGIEGGIKNKYEIKPIVFNFRKKIKSSLISNFNNTGVIPLTLQDYNSIINAKTISNESNTSQVIFVNNDDVPKFLLAGDKVKNRSTNFSTLSAIVKPSKKLKVDFYSIFNNSRQKNVISREQILANVTTPIRVFENTINLEENYLGISKLKAIYKTTDNSVLTFDYNFDVDVSKEYTAIDNKTNDSIGFFSERINPERIASKFDVSYSSKWETSHLKANIYLNNIQLNSNLDILGNQPFLGLQFEQSEFQVSQKIDRKNLLSGFNVNFSKEYLNFSYTLYSSISYNKQSFSSENNILELGVNNLRLKSRASTIGSEFSYRFSPVFSSIFGLGYNYDLRNLNENSRELIFLDTSLLTKARFSSNHVATLGYAYANQKTSLDTIYEGAVITDYRNIFSSNTISFAALFPYHKFNYEHFIFNSRNHTSLIFKATYKTSNSSIGTDVINRSNVTSTIYTSIEKDQSTSLFFFFEKKIPNLPLSFSNSISYDFSNMQYFQEGLPNEFDTNTLGGNIQFNSRFKKSPVHFKLGYLYSFEKYVFSGLESNVSKQQPFVNINGALNKNLFWEIENIYKTFSIDGIRRNIYYLNPQIRYNDKNSDWEFSVTGTNILNLNNNTIVENTTIPGLTQRRITTILEGNILFGLEYNF